MSYIHTCKHIIDLCEPVMDYRIMQIVRGGKVSQLYNLPVICRKNFAIVQQSEIPYNKKIIGKPSRLEANPQKPLKFSTANDLHYTVCIYKNTLYT